MKIGIISEFKINTVNYGNHLQAYALNKYLRNTFPDWAVETLYFKNSKKLAITSYLALLKRLNEKIWQKLRGRKSFKLELDSTLVEARLSAFRQFQKTNIVLSPQEMSWQKLLESDYDMFIVGSDVVWTQSKAFFNRIKFLDFENKKKAVKVSYAASFGQNVIPKGNRRSIKKALQKFKGVSVRENSAVELLHSIGVEKAVQTADPTLLLPAEAWSVLEREPRGIKIGKPFVFAYLLGANKEQKQMVDEIYKVRNIPIVYIPYATGTKQADEIHFGDTPVADCSPEEWIWLIHHAEYMVTDSFHGVVFATIFEKKFLVLKRNYVKDINIRLTDYLSMLGQDDKVVVPDKIVDFDTLEWDYRKINQKLEELRIFSKAFLANVCRK